MSAVWILDDDKSIRWVFEKALEKANLPFKIFSNTHRIDLSSSKTHTALMIYSLYF